MQLEDLKSGWQNAGSVIKNEADLLAMTKVTNHPSLKKIRRKIIIETMILVPLLFLYYDGFDGDKKPLYANVLLVISLLLYIINDVIGYISLVKPVNGIDLKSSIANYTASVKRLSVTSLITSFLYSACLITFFASVINFTKEKTFLLLGMIIILVQVILWSHRIWKKWIKNLDQQVTDLELN